MSDLTPESFLLLTASALVAGFVDAIAGGGGLITVPALALAGLDPDRGDRNQQSAIELRFRVGPHRLCARRLSGAQRLADSACGHRGRCSRSRAARACSAAGGGNRVAVRARRRRIVLSLSRRQSTTRMPRRECRGWLSCLRAAAHCLLRWRVRTGRGVLLHARVHHLARLRRAPRNGAHQAGQLCLEPCRPRDAGLLRAHLLDRRSGDGVARSLSARHSAPTRQCGSARVWSGRWSSSSASPSRSRLALQHDSVRAAIGLQ